VLVQRSLKKRECAVKLEVLLCHTSYASLQNFFEVVSTGWAGICAQRASGSDSRNKKTCPEASPVGTVPPAPCLRKRHHNSLDKWDGWVQFQVGFRSGLIARVEKPQRLFSRLHHQGSIPSRRPYCYRFRLLAWPVTCMKNAVVAWMILACIDMTSSTVL
jgi:hypothetical protein